jgi:hypothetical protein
MNKKALIFTFIMLIGCTALSFGATKTYANLDQQTGWKSCDACSGINQKGPVTLRSATPNVTTPTMDGHSLALWIGGNNRYGSALFWKGLGNTTARHYKIDLYFYLKNSAAAQALEFDIYQDIAGKHLVLGNECSIKTSHMWSTYDTKNAHWVPTSAPCSYVAPYTWHHMITEHESLPDGRTHMISITMDGKKYYINKYYYSRAGSGQQATLGLQLDGDAKTSSYSVWYDKVQVITY